MCMVVGYNKVTGRRDELYRCVTPFMAAAFIRRYDDFNGLYTYLTWYGPGDGR